MPPSRSTVELAHAPPWHVRLPPSPAAPSQPHTRLTPHTPPSSPWPAGRRNYEESYSDPGSPLTRRTEWGTYALARITPDEVTLAALRQAAAAAAAAAPVAAPEAPAADGNGANGSSGNGSGAAAAAVGGAGKPPTLQGLSSGSGTWMLMEGSGASPEGNRPFLDLLHLESGTHARMARMLAAHACFWP